MKENYRRRMMAARDPRYAKIATRLGYGTRDMVADRDEPGEPVAPVTHVEDIDAVRAEYERVVGRRPFYGWDIQTLRQRMVDAKDAD